MLLSDEWNHEARADVESDLLVDRAVFAAAADSGRALTPIRVTPDEMARSGEWVTITVVRRFGALRWTEERRVYRSFHPNQTR